MILCCVSWLDHHPVAFYLVRGADQVRKGQGLCRQVVKTNRALYEACGEIQAVITSMRLSWPFLQIPPLTPTAQSCACTYDVISLVDFLDNANTGDVVLFDTSSCLWDGMRELSVAGLDQAIAHGHDSYEYAPYAAMLQQDFGDFAETEEIAQELADSWLRQMMQVQSSSECFEWNHCAIVINTPAQKKFLVGAVKPKVVAWRIDKAMEAWLKDGSRIGWRPLRVQRQLVPAQLTPSLLPGSQQD